MNREGDRLEGTPNPELEEKHAVLTNDAARQRLQGDRAEANFDRGFRDVTSEGDKAVAQRLRDQSDAEFKETHQELLKRSTNSELSFSEPKDEMINVRRIAPPRITDPGHNSDTPEFWYEHGRSPQEYLDAGEKYRTIRTRLNEGASFEDLKRDKDLGGAVNFWYGDPVRVEGYKGRYFADDGIHRVELAQRLGLGEIPAKVRYAIPRGSS